MIVHLTVRAEHPPVLLTDHEVAEWLWAHLRAAFPLTLSATLMPNHPHVITETGDVAASKQTLQNVLSGLRRSSNPGSHIRWEPIPEPDVITDAQKARRGIRYVTLNPCRAGLVDDPLRWPWSTHRDVVGAIADPWVDATRLAAALDQPIAGFADRHHGYVSSAPSVSVVGTPLPQRARPTTLAKQPLEELIAAAAAATRATPAAIRQRSPTRTLFLRLAVRHGWNDTAQLANLCGIGVRAVQKYRGRPADAGLAAAELCLGDDRLRAWKVEGRKWPRANFSPRHPWGRGPEDAFAELRGMTLDA